MILPGVLLAAFAGLWLTWSRWSVLRWPRPHHRAINILLALAVVATLTLAWMYVSTPTYWDHLEPAFAMKGLAIGRGELAYPPIVGAARTQLVYGPAAYAAHVVIAGWFSDPIAGSKLSTVVTATLGLGLVSLALARFGAGIRGYAGLYCLAGLFLFREILFRQQADGVLFLAVAIGGWAALRPSRGLSLVAWSAAIAIATATKPHGAVALVVFLPLLVSARGVTPIILATATGAVLALAPFLLPPFGLAPYAETLLAVSRHDLLPKLLLGNLSMATIMAVPLAVSWYNRRHHPHPSFNRVSVLILTGSTAVLCLVGAKEGAGIHHLLPLCASFPLATAALCDLSAAESASGSTRRASHSLTGGWIVAVAVQGILIQGSYVGFLSSSSSTACPGAADVVRALDNRSWRVAVGYTDDESYGCMWQRPAFRAALTADIFEPLSVADMARGGHPLGQATLDFIAREHMDAFILPATGSPFTMTNWYDRTQPLFGRDLSSVFQAHYHPQQRHGAYVIWAANRLRF